MSKETKTFSVKALVKKVDGKLFAIASTETKDRMGDVVKVGGWKLSSFKKNPVLLFAHKYNEAPVGIAKSIKIQDKKLVFEPAFHEITQLAREVGKMYQEGIMRAFSVGFLPLKFDEKDMHVIQEQELLEISAVPVPANAEALTQVAKSLKPQEVKDVSDWLDKTVDEFPEIKDDKEDDDKIEEDVEEGTKDENNEEDTDDEIEKDIGEEIDKSEVIEKPFPNEHACRLKAPKEFESFARKNCQRKSDGKCIDVIFGIKEGKSQVQGLRYAKSVWTSKDAEAHCKKQGGKFEQAASKGQETDCECPDTKEKKPVNMISVRTAPSDGHTHVATIDDEVGNGETTIDEEHKHTVRNFSVSQVDSHTHLLPENKSEYKKPKKRKEESTEEDISEKVENVMRDVLENITNENKEGRVLSGKNRAMIKETVIQLKDTVSALQNLLDATESAASGEGKTKKGRAEVAQGLLKDRVVVRALQKMSGDLSQILNKAKNK